MEKSALKVKNKILLVDDINENLTALQRQLRKPDRLFFSSNSGQEALSILEDEDISLVILDIKMPGIDGWEVATRLKADQKTSTIPIIAVTAYAMPNDRQKALNAGCDDYIPKPCAPNEVVDKVSHILSKKGGIL